MLCNIKPVPFYESDKYIFAKFQGGGGGGGGGVSGPPVLPSGSAHGLSDAANSLDCASFPAGYIFF